MALEMTEHQTADATEAADATETCCGSSRRALLRAAGVGGAAAAVAITAAACGSSGSNNDSASSGGGAATSAGSAPSTAASSASSASSGSGSGGGSPLAKTADVPVDGGTIVTDDGGTVITQPAAGTYKAFTAICTHQGCTVGSVSNNQIMCPCHGSMYSAKDGSVIQGPATQPLAAKTIKVTGGQIFLA